MNYKRKKSRRKVRCAICTPHRHGNAKWNRPVRDLRKLHEEVSDASVGN